MQLILLAVLPAVIATTGVVLVLSIQHLHTVDAVTQTNAQTAARQLAGWAREPLANMERRALQQVARTGTSQAQIQQVQIWSADGELLASSSSGRRDPQPGLQVTAPIDAGNPGAQIAIEFSLASVHAAQQRAWLNMVLALAASLLGVVLAGTWAARRIGAPVRELAAAVDRLGAGEPARVDPDGTAEVRQLQKGFNKAATALTESRHMLESRIQQATAELERKNHQIELVSQAKTRLLAAASHDLRQPLHALTLFSESLAADEADPVRLQRLRYVRECVESLDNLFSELLNISQIDAGVLKPQRSDFALDRLFDDVSRNFRPVAEAKDLRLIVRHTDLWVNADYYMLLRIVSNLVSNSLRHTATGGVLVAARRRGGRVRIEVIDTGTGIAPEHQQRVFEEFYQLGGAGRGRGMGLGLATVQRLAGLLRAEVGLSSVEGHGTCVRVGIPAALPHRQADHARARAATVTAPAADCLAGKRVLVIDDEPTILEGLRIVFSGWGAKVLTARCGTEALHLAERWSEPPDVVMVDLNLRDGEQGAAVMSALRRHPRGLGPHTAQVFVTGDTEVNSLPGEYDGGIPVFHKPLTPAELRRAIQQQWAAAQRACVGAGAEILAPLLNHHAA